MGPKTETALIEAGAPAPPESLEPTAFPTTLEVSRGFAHAIVKAFNDEENVERVMAERPEKRFELEVNRKAVICIARKITSNIVDGDPIDDDYVVGWKGLRSSTNPKPIWRKFGGDLGKVYLTRGEIGAHDLLDAYNRIVSPIEDQILFPLTKVLSDLTTNPFGGDSLKEKKERIPECRAVKPIYLRSQKETSIYWCLRGWLKERVGVCFE